MSEPHTRIRPPPSASNGALLAALLGAPVVWAVHLAVSYFLVALDCNTSWEGGETAVLLATLLCALAAGGSGVVAWRWWKRARGNRRGDLLDSANVQEFLALAGAALAALFAGTIVLTGISPLFLPICS
jgi:uncharacterized membrane protein YidH (DUF202 family)